MQPIYENMDEDNCEYPITLNFYFMNDNEADVVKNQLNFEPTKMKLLWNKGYNRIETAGNQSDLKITFDANEYLTPIMIYFCPHAQAHAHAHD